MKWTPCIAMICIAGLESIALCKGINGTLFALAIAAISGLGGYSIKELVNKIKGGGN